MKNKIKDMNVIELFKQFCKERHAEDKGKNYDLLQEIYAKTELFDLSFLSKEAPDLAPFWNGDHTYTKDNFIDEVHFTDDAFKDITLPFESQFIKVGKAGGTDDVFMFVREFSPNTLTGTLYIKFREGNLNNPFTINTSTGRLTISMKGIYDYAFFLKNKNLDEKTIDLSLQFLLNGAFPSIPYSLKAICNLQQHSVVSDTPKHAEYYTRKHGSTIKAIKPIYYVMDKKEETEKRNYNRIKPLGHLAFDHSFKVRGHWRKINPHTYGKNRQGEYIVTGMTWVKEHVRGEGDLIKKIRVVK